MVGEIASPHALSDAVIDGVGERTGGVPLFVEEVTRLLLERDAHGGAQAIPPTLQQSLAARLDRLGEAREVAQIGAVLGRAFSYRLLSDVSSSAAGFDELRLQVALDRLTESDLLFADGAASDRRLSFQACADPGCGLREPAQEPSPGAASPRGGGVARRRRRARSNRPSFHRGRPRRCGNRMVGQGGRSGAPPLGLPGGDRSLGKAIEMADRAGAAATAPAAASTVGSQRLKLETAYGQAMMYSKGFAAEETKAAFARAVELAPGARTSRAFCGGPRSMDRRARARRTEVGAGDGRGVPAGGGERGATRWRPASRAAASLGSATFVGDFAPARAHCERALAAC